MGWWSGVPLLRLLGGWLLPQQHLMSSPMHILTKQLTQGTTSHQRSKRRHILGRAGVVQHWLPHHRHAAALRTSHHPRDEPPTLDELMSFSTGSCTIDTLLR